MYSLLELERNLALNKKHRKRERHLRTLPPEERQDAFFEWTEKRPAPKAKLPSPKRQKRGLQITKQDPWGFDAMKPGITDRFPALKQRNFYIIQLHHATANHFDIRLQCSLGHLFGIPCDICGGAIHKGKNQKCPGTLSFAVPRGLSDFKVGKCRLGVETELHGIAYSLHEGSGIGCTMMWDVGTYRIITPAASSRDKGADTSDEGSDGEDEETEWGGKVGRNHEEMLAKHYKGNNEKSTFSIELKGERYHMRLTFSHIKTASQQKHVKQKWHKRQSLRRKWIIQLARPLIPGGERLNKENKEIGDVSIFTGRPISEYKKGKTTVTKLSDIYEGEKDGTANNVFVKVGGPPSFQDMMANSKEVGAKQLEEMIGPEKFSNIVAKAGGRHMLKSASIRKFQHDGQNPLQLNAVVEAAKAGASGSAAQVSLGEETGQDSCGGSGDLDGPDEWDAESAAGD